VRTRAGRGERIGPLAGIALAGLLSAAVPAPARSEPSVERQAELRDLLTQDCGSCHGLTRRGGLGAPLTPEALAGKSDAYLVAVTLDGIPGTAMPPWRRFLTEEEAVLLARWLREGVAR
jgi:cytochrome c55X